MSQNEAQASDVPAPPESREPYETPRLQRFGALAEITRAIGTMGVMDGGSVNGMKNSRP